MSKVFCPNCGRECDRGYWYPNDASYHDLLCSFCESENAQVQHDARRWPPDDIFPVDLQNMKVGELLKFFHSIISEKKKRG